jgi:hypothetical protein|tara:strand:+ start:2119 stop:2298 length:180 start_codon:yes stop_codon:yes gene_type:complete
MKKVRVYWSEVMHLKGDLEVPDGLTKEEEYDWVCANLPFDVAKDIGSEIEADSIEIESA